MNDYSTQIQSIYIAYYGRPADPTGLDFWQTKFQESNGDLTQIIEAFTSSAEAKANFDVLSDSEMIDAIYLQTLNREPELGGKAYYLQRMANGTSTHGTIALDVLRGAFTTNDSEIVWNKLMAAESFTNLLRSDSNTLTRYLGAVDEIKDWIGQIHDSSWSLPWSSRVDFSEEVQKIYIAYYGRPADPNGMFYWASVLAASNGDLSEIINSFANSDEAEANFGLLSDSEIIDAIYLQTLNRHADIEGMTFYLSRLENGEFSRGSIALNVVGGATGDDLSVITAKLEAAQNFTTALMNYTNYWSYYGEELNAEAKAWLGREPSYDYNPFPWDFAIIGPIYDYGSDVQLLSIAYYGRPASPVEMDHWIVLLEKNEVDFSQVDNLFAATDEAKAYIDGLSNFELIDSAYLRIFDRSPYDEEMVYYSNLLLNGTLSPADIASSILYNSFYSESSNPIWNKLSVANHITTALYNDTAGATAYISHYTEAKQLMEQIGADFFEPCAFPDMVYDFGLQPRCPNEYLVEEFLQSLFI